MSGIGLILNTGMDSIIARDSPPEIILQKRKGRFVRSFLDFSFSMAFPYGRIPNYFLETDTVNMMIGIQSLLHDIAGLRKHEDDIAGRSIEK